MGFFRNLFQNRGREEAIRNWMLGLSAVSGADTVTERKSMELSAVYACVRLLAEDLASLPLHIYQEDKDGNKHIAKDHILNRLLYVQPNEEQSSFVFRETVMTNILLWGNGYIQKLHDNSGKIVGLYPLLSERMLVKRNDATDEIEYHYATKRGVKVFHRDEILHIPGLSFDGLVGLSPIQLARRTISTAQSAMEFGQKFFENGARPSGILTLPGHLENKDLIRDSWNTQFGSAENAGKTAVLEEGMKYQSISLSPTDAQFLDTQKYTVTEICRLFRVPPHMVADLEKATFSNIEQQSLDYVQNTLRPWVVRWEQAIQTQLLTELEQYQGYYAKFNVDALLRGDFATRMSGYATARQNGLMSINEIRDLMDMNKIPAELGGDDYLALANLQPLRGGEQNDQD